MINAVAGGGIGDCLRSCFSDLSGDVHSVMKVWGQFKDYKKKHPDEEIHVEVASLNPVAIQLFETIPYFDRVFLKYIPQVEGERLKGSAEDWYALCDLTKRLANYKWEQPQIVLDVDEQKYFQEVIDAGPFVVFSPYGGFGPRTSIGKYEYLIDRLQEVGYNIVVSGASYSMRVDRSSFFKEEFPYSSDKIFNLMDHGPRLAAVLTMNASFYIGSISCLMHAAFIKKVPSFCFTCYEVWESNDAKVQNHYPVSLHALNTKQSHATWIVINNDNNLKPLWDQVITLMQKEPEFRFIVWGDGYRKPVSFVRWGGPDYIQVF